MLLKGQTVVPGYHRSGSQSGLDGTLSGRVDCVSNSPNSQRRGLLRAAVGAGALALAPGLLVASPKLERKLTLYAPSTGEMIKICYWTPSEGYIEASIAEMSEVMRDRHSGDIKRIDPRLFDLIFALQTQLAPRQPIHVLSGYRSPATNARLRRRNKGVAKASLHMQGQAADIRMPDRDFNQLHKAALSLEAGGVGRYRRSRFVHVDTGPVRNWG